MRGRKAVGAGSFLFLYGAREKSLCMIPGVQHTTGHLIERTASEERLCAFFTSTFAHSAQSKSAPHAMHNSWSKNTVN